MRSNLKSLPKTATGIEGLDEITHGGLPTGRPTLVAGGAGSGKTVLGLEFIIHGALTYNEPGVFLAFEETEKDLAENVASFGYDLEKLQKEGKVIIDHVHLERDDFVETGAFDLEGLFIRLGNAVDTIKARRVVLDTVEVLFATLQNQAVVRAELLRLFRWIKARGLTAIVTGERGDGKMTRFGLEEYVADCVILLDHRVSDQLSTRRVRIVKYRGSLHSMDEHPFLMGESGISILPITSAGLAHTAPPTAYLPACPTWTRCWAGKASFAAAAFLSRGRRAPASPA
jgi:circadian clock protein KaiC